jgi:hypothetical protein
MANYDDKFIEEISNIFNGGGDRNLSPFVQLEQVIVKDRNLLQDNDFEELCVRIESFITKEIQELREEYPNHYKGKVFDRDVYFPIDELREDELEELKEIWEIKNGVWENGHPNYMKDISMSEVKEHYKGTEFVEEDFFCNV